VDRHRDEEPQEARGAPGSRDTGSDAPAAGPADRPAGRQRAADPAGSGGTGREGADVGGARRHRTGGRVDADDGGGTTSPAEERPAGEVDGSGQEDPGTGPSHVPGVPRGEDRSG
jgi:hypothetical protein